MFDVRMAVTGALLIGGLHSVASAQGGGRRMQPPPDGSGMMGPRGRGPRQTLRAQLLRGITLTDAQKATLQQATESYRTQSQAAGTQRRIDMLSVRQARLRGDTAAMHAARAKVLTDTDQGAALRARFMDGVRASLTSDQQKVFDRNTSRIHSMAARAARMRARNRNPGAAAARRNGAAVPPPPAQAP